MRPITTVLLALSIAANAHAQCWGVSAAPAVAGLRFASPLPAAPRIVLPPHVVPEAVVFRPDPPAPPKRPAPPRPRVIGGRKCDCGDACPHKGCPDGCSCAKGEGKEKPAEPELPTGVERDKLSAELRYTIGGKPVTRAEAVRSIEQLVDDSTKHRLTLFGGDETTRRALRQSLLADPGVSSAVLCQDYPSGHWAVAKHPPLGPGVSVYLQQPSGKTLWSGPGEGDSAVILKRVKQALGLAPPDAPAPAPIPSPHPVGPDGKPVPPAPDPLAAWLARLKAELGFHPAFLLLGAGALYVLSRRK